jgi:FKBP-type peptidyl-prolyl cis-trans isomerase (trigger factor)
MASSKKTVKEVRDEMRESAIQHVKVGLAMRKFATEHEVLVTEEEIDAKANEHLAVYKTIPQAQANIDVDELRERVTYTLKNQKTLKKLAELVEKK